MVDTVVAAGCRELLTSRTLTTLDEMLPTVLLGGAVVFTANCIGMFSVTAGSEMTVFMVFTGGDLVVDRIMISWKFGNNKLFPRFFFWDCMEVFSFWFTIEVTSVVKSLYFCVSGGFSLVSPEVIAADDVIILFGLRLNLLAADSFIMVAILDFMFDGTVTGKLSLCMF
jgi:hypothetical protein